MRVTFLGQACHLVESGGFRVLTDPWLCDPAFGGLIEHDPPLAFSIADLGRLDAIAITHGHLDHFSAPTLVSLADKSIPVVHPTALITELDRNLLALGFTNLHPLADWEHFELGDLRVVATPAQGVIDECAYAFTAPDGSFWDGADAPQIPSVLEEVAHRFGPMELGAFGHNSFDQPRLLGLDSVKDPEHGPLAGLEAARILGVRAAFPAASSMRWTGERGDEITKKVVRRSAANFVSLLKAELPEVEALDLSPGDAWPAAGGLERAVVSGSPAPRVPNDYIHAVLGNTAEETPSTEETFRRLLPELTAARTEAGRAIGRRVFVDVIGEDPGRYTVDFAEPGAMPDVGDCNADFAFEIRDDDWKGLFTRTLSWQILIMSDRLRVTRHRAGPPPDGLNFAYALQGLFP